MASHLACLGLAPEQPPFDVLMEALLRSGTSRGLEDGWTGVTFTDPSGARVVFGVHPDGGVPVLQPSFAGARRQPFALTTAPVAPASLALGELGSLGLALDLADPLALTVQGESGATVALTLLAESVRPAGPGDADAFAPVGLLAVGSGEPEPAALAVGTVVRATMRRTAATALSFVHVELRTPAGILDVCCDPADLDGVPAAGVRLLVEAYVVGALQ